MATVCTAAAVQVLRRDVEASTASAAALGRAVFERAAAAFTSMMAAAIPQLRFRTRTRGSSMHDGVDVLFRAVSNQTHVQLGCPQGVMGTSDVLKCMEARAPAL